MRSHNFVDLSGRRFGRLTVVSLLATKPKTRWNCSCDCGAHTTKLAPHLVNGLSQSCGCLRRETAAEALRKVSTKHGLCAGGSPQWYLSWRGMMSRCYAPATTRYARYGGRGICVVPAWHDPNQFFADMGEPPPGHTLERRDNDGNYGPDNCSWETRLQQNNNRVTTRKLTFNGKTLSAAAWAREIGIAKASMYERLRKWPIEQALSTARGGS